MKSTLVRLGELRAANAAVDEAIAAYERRKALLRKQCGGDAGAFHVAKRDDLVLKDLGSTAEFRTAQVTRLAATLTAELLATTAPPAALPTQLERVR